MNRSDQLASESNEEAPRPGFHPLIQVWFEARFSRPTPVQAAAWPKIAAREHLLITAPTGSGKTLTAFLWAINRFATGELLPGATRILYVSPLKALNNDIQRNLLEPLGEIRERFDDAGIDFPGIAVRTRSGDTDSDERRRMLRTPPEILITTPESLNLMLSSAGGQSILGALDTVILDEIHAVVGDKRGVYLMSAVERLVSLSGEFQRIALSATVNPMDTVASVVGGFRRHGDGYRARRVNLVTAPSDKVYDIQVRYPIDAQERGADDQIWDALVPDFVERIGHNRSTLLFVNSRMLCEKLTHKINQHAGHTLAWAHHGSLSREIRTDVEQRLKSGALAAIVATSTLEMGIDIGALDEVLLIQSPDSIASSVQRIGRAGHQVGGSSRCTIYPTYAQDFIEATVLARAVLDGDIEPVRTIERPLDVLAQIMISMTGTAVWDIDDLFAEIRRSTAYQTLTRGQFDLVLNMLAGRYADHHIRELRPRVRIDRLANQVQARKGALMSLYLSGGVIPDRGYFQLRHEDSNSRIGELDEEFVWETRIGQVFSLGTQQWQVRKITHSDVLVGPARPTGIAPPFWKSEPLSRNFHYAERIGNFLEHANDVLDDEEFASELQTAHRLEADVSREVIAYLGRQRKITGIDLPHRHHLVVERIASAPGGVRAPQIVLHTLWGARVNRPFAMAMEAAWQDRFGELPEVYVGNESIVLQLPHDVTTDQLMTLVSAKEVEKWLRARLEGSGFFGARFRENAGRALLLTRSRFNERKPLWMSRLQSQKLLAGVMKYEDFPILLETWRTCLQDEFDLKSLEQVLGELERGEIVVSDISLHSPSPFAQAVAWGQVNTYMYMNDQPKASGVSNLSSDLLAEVVFSPELRPRLPADLVAQFEQRQHRLAPGYAPETAEELLEWVKERTLIPFDEWQPLTRQVAADGDKIATIESGSARLIVAREDEPRIKGALTGDQQALKTVLANWLQHYGPVSTDRIESSLGISGVQPLLEALHSEGVVIHGALIAGDETVYWCEAASYEFLLRLLRTRHQTSFEPRATAGLVPFLYHWQTRQIRQTADEPVDRLFEVINQMRGYRCPAAHWETDLLPARLPGYQPRDLDELFAEGDLMWLGMGDRQVTFCFEDDIELLLDTPHDESAVLPGALGRYDFGTLADVTRVPASELSRRLWEETWQTRITNDSVAALRTGIQQDFKVPTVAGLTGGRGRGVRRGGYRQWRNAVPFAGNWRGVANPEGDGDAVTRDEIERERVRMLIARYGILFRELVNREQGALGWGRIFRALRLMELSGELISGYFFRDIAGPQFISPAALKQLQQPRRGNGSFWLNATDPISPCGLGLAGLGDTPRRIPSNYLVYRDNQMVLVIERQGRSLTFLVPPDDPGLSESLEVLRHITYRAFQPRRKLVFETINDEPATASPYLKVLEDAFDLVRDHRSVSVQRHV
ncbi:MAG: DEAD/DEAH box helicase [Proteobacteria bacterium]|jgi:ATP-dependent Lhr-like helicase|nr:DEAD/DEAH box helicase [Pseudomonadota bacterium]MDA1299572.1 DEAD/DEAH box helicase [Pseudomonadota bacterium]